MSEGGASEESILIQTEPERLGRYELIRRLKGGGFCETYLARYHGPDGWMADVCLKRVLPEHKGDDDYVKPMRDEAVIMAAVSHPNIPKVIEYGCIAGTHYIVMTLIDGVTLKELLSRLAAENRRLPVHVALFVIYKVLRALDAAHRLVLRGDEQQVIHRDVTPNNIMLDRNGTPFLFDFGLVKAKERKYQTQQGMVRGTLPYIAPETFLQSLPEYPTREDARTDIYTVGVVLYELLAGRHPFVNPGPKGLHDDVVRLIAKGQCPPLAELAPELPAGLAEVVHRMMARGMEERPRSAMETCELLAPYLKSEFRAELDASELVIRAQGDRPRHSISDTRLHGVNTATRVREKPAAMPKTEDAEPQSGEPSRVVPPQEAPAPSPQPRIDAAPTTVEAGGSSREQNHEGPVITAVIPAPVTQPGPSRVPTKRPTRVLATAIVILSVAVAGALAWSQQGPTTGLSSPAREAAPDPRSFTSSPETALAQEPEPPTTESAPPPQASIARNSTTKATDALPEPAAPEEALEGSERARTPAKRPSIKPTSDAPTATTAERNAWLNVQIAKEGTWHVWVDSQYGGTAPVNVKVSQGRHVVEVGLDKPSLKRVVRVAPNGTRDVNF